MQPHNIDLESGQVIFWDLDSIDETRPLSEQLDNLKEDLAQIDFGPNLILDVGWYPSFSESGQFVVVLNHREHWDDPEFRCCCKTVEELSFAVSVGMTFALFILNRSSPPEISDGSAQKNNDSDRQSA